MDLLPQEELDILPNVETIQSNSVRTSKFKGALGSAASEAYQAIALPKSEQEWEAIMSSKEGEDRVKESLFAIEQKNSLSVRDQVAREAILKGATEKDLKFILSPRKADEEEALKNSVLERGAAKFLVEQGLASPTRAASIVNEEFTEGRNDTTQREEFTATMLRLNSLRNKIADKFESSNFFDKTLDFAAMLFVPGHATVKGASAFGRGKERLGTSILKFSENFWNAPLVERLKIIDNFEKELDNNEGFGKNLFKSMEQLEQIISYKPEQKIQEDFTEAVDATAILAFPIRAVQLIRQFRNISNAATMAGAKDVVAGRTIILRDAETAAIDEAGRFADDGGPVARRWNKETGQFDDVDELVENIVPSAIVPEKVIEKPTGPVNKLIQDSDTIKEIENIKPVLQAELKKVSGAEAEVFDPARILQIVRGTVIPEVLNETEQAAANMAAYKAILDRVMPTPRRKAEAARQVQKPLPAYDVDIDDLTGIRTVNVYLGTGENKLDGFSSYAGAVAGAKRMGLDEKFYSISDRSGEYFIKVSQNAGSTQFISPMKAEEIPSVLPILGKYVQGSKTTSSLDALKGARLSSNAASKIAKQIDNEAKKISSLPPKSREAYNNLMLEIQQNEKWKNSAELKDWFITNYQREPTKKEKEAYSATRQLYYYDYAVRNSTIKNELVSAGYQEIKVKDIHNSPVIGKQVETTSVDPKATKIFDANTNKFVEFNSREELKDFLSKNKNSILVKTLSETEEHGQYIITTRPNLNVKPLRAMVLRWHDGPHRIYEGDHFIKQQKIRTLPGIGPAIVNPKTHFAVKGIRDATKYAEEYNQALAAWKSAKNSGSSLEKAKATEVISRNTYFSSFDEFDAAIKDGRIESTPFEVLKSGELPKHQQQNIRALQMLDPDFSNFSEGLQTSIEQGRMFYSERGPRLRHPKEGLAPLLHPNEIMTRAISNVINTQAYTNYKIRQVERWVKGFGKYIVGYDPSRPSIETFMYGKWDTSPNAKYRLPESQRRSAEAQRESIKRFLSQTGVLEEDASRFRNELIDLIDNKFGSKYSDRFANITSNNPIAFARGVAFKFYLGMADVSQLLVQMSMTPGIAAVAPKQTARMLSIYPFLRFASLNPNHLESVANKVSAAKLMDKKQFVELFNDIRKSGVDIVDGNLGDLDNINNKTALKGFASNAVSRGTDALSFFFNEAERTNRVMGFGISWLENYEKTGKSLQSADEFASVGVRGDAFAGNMNRDGKAWWQNGWLSIPTQFAAHPARVTELLIAPTPGGFTKAEKLRYYSGLALAYGPLLGAGGALTNYATEKYREATGTDPDPMVINAITSGIVGAAFPETDISRLQPFGGETLLSELYSNDGGIGLDDMLGPSGKLGSRFVEATIGSRKLWALMTGQVDFDIAPLTLADIGNDVLKTISSYNRLDKAITAWQMKIYTDRQGRVLQEDLDSFDALMIGLGFPPRESSEAYEASIRLEDHRNKVYKDAMQASIYLKKALNAEEGSAEARKYYSYFHYLAKLNHIGDISGDGGELFSREVDKQMKNTKAYNQAVFERVYRDLKKKPLGIVRE